MIVCDTHAGGGDIRIPEMLAAPRVTYHGRSREVQGGKSPWMPGMDQSVDGLLLLGHHAKAVTEGAFLPHTWQLDWADFRIDGQSVGEMGIEACFAGYWDVPVILAQGDEAVCREAEAQFPGAVTAAVKRTVTRADSPEAGRHEQPVPAGVLPEVLFGPRRLDAGAGASEPLRDDAADQLWGGVLRRHAGPASPAGTAYAARAWSSCALMVTFVPSENEMAARLPPFSR